MFDFIKTIKAHKKLSVSLAMAFAVLCIVDASYRQNLGKDSFHPRTVTWRLLSLLDPKTGDAPTILKMLNGKYIRIPGYMVPLEDDYQHVSEFLLVPTQGACIHVPAPPANQMIHVFVGKTTADMTWEPVWALGKLEIGQSDSPYGSAYFRVTSAQIQPYEHPGHGGGFFGMEN